MKIKLDGVMETLLITLYARGEDAKKEKSVLEDKKSEEIMSMIDYDNGKIEWYNLDFPEVIEKRKLFFPENERVKNISKSALDPAWTKDVKVNGKKLLIISEGVLMYFDENEVKDFLKILTDNFDEFEAQFDLISKGALKMQKEHDTLKKMNAKFKWAVKDGSEVVKLNPLIKQTGLINFTAEMKKILPFTKKWIIPFMYLYNNRLGIYEYKKKND